jgi:hypothetical protein
MESWLMLLHDKIIALSPERLYDDGKKTGETAFNIRIKDNNAILVSVSNDGGAWSDTWDLDYAIILSKVLAKHGLCFRKPPKGIKDEWRSWRKGSKKVYFSENNKTSLIDIITEFINSAYQNTMPD